MGFLLHYDSKDLQEGSLYGWIVTIFFFLGGRDPSKEKCRLAT